MSRKPPSMEKQLKSLVRERQRLWQMYFWRSGSVRIRVVAEGMSTQFNEGVMFPFEVIDFYMARLNKKICELTDELAHR